MGIVVKNNPRSFLQFFSGRAEATPLRSVDVRLYGGNFVVRKMEIKSVDVLSALTCLCGVF